MSSDDSNLNLLEEFKKFRLEMDAKIAKCTVREQLPIQKNYWEMVRQTFPIWCEEMRQYEARRTQMGYIESSQNMRSRSPGRNNTASLGNARETGPLNGPVYSGWPSWQAPGGSTSSTMPPYQRY